jgi:hypothetical protein
VQHEVAGARRVEHVVADLTPLAELDDILPILILGAGCVVARDPVPEAKLPHVFDEQVFAVCG